MNFFIFFSLFPLAVLAKSFVSQNFSASFEERIFSKALGKEKKSYGKIDYKYPGHIRFEITSPNPSLFISNPAQSWYYVPAFLEGEEGQVTIQKSNKLPLSNLLDSMKNGLENSKLFKHNFRANDLVLIFNANSQKETSLSEVIFHANKDAKLVANLGEFDTLTIQYVDGQKVSLKFIDFKIDSNFSEKHFEFDVPKKTKILRN